MKNSRFFLGTFFVTALAISLTTCGGGGGSGTNSSSGETSLNLSGAWSGSWISAKTTINGDLSTTLTQSGSTISGTISISDSPCISSTSILGNISNNNVSFANDSLRFSATATASPTALVGGYSVTSGSCAGDAGYFALSFNDNNNTPPQPTANVTGHWSGTYSSNLVSSAPIILDLKQTGANVTGTDSSSNGAAGHITGIVSGNTLAFNIVQYTISCIGAFTGNASVNGDNINLNFAGSDCLGIHSSGSGTITKLSPDTPTGVSAVPGASQITISWNASPRATSYNIYWSTSPQVKTSYQGISSTFGPPYTFSGSCGQNYYFAVTAFNQYGESDKSDVVSAVDCVPPGASVLASSLDWSDRIALDASNVYWTEYNSISEVGINGGTISILASSVGNHRGIAVDSSNVYWTEYDGNTVKKVSINGGPVTILASGLIYPYGIAVDSNSVYWSEWGGTGTIKKVDVNGGTVITLATGFSSPEDIALDSTSIYWIANVSINKVGKNGGPVTTLFSGSHSNMGVAVDSQNVYWIDNGGNLSKVSINGGLVTTIATGLNQPSCICLDDNYVYWGEYLAIKKASKSGGSVTTILGGLSATPRGIVVDANYVYWTDSATVKKVPKN